MKEIQQIYNNIVGDISSASDLVLKVNDLYTVMILLVTKAFEVAPDDQKSFIIDSVKLMTNQYIERLMKIITEEELKTVDKNDR